MRRLLVVDDNEQNRHMIEFVFKRAGWQVAVAADGAQALEQARRDPPELVVSDILMPVMDGFALCREWCADERLKHIPFVFYTATYTDSKDEEFALSLGADRFVRKPENPRRLLEIAEEVLAQNVADQLKVASPATADEAVVLRQYNAVLVRKLEKKLLDLEAAQREREAGAAERARAETALREQLTELEAVYKATPAGLVQIDRELRFVRINDRLAAINGLPAAEHIGRTLCDVLPELGPRLEPLYRNIFETGEPAEDLEVQGSTAAHPGEIRNWLANFFPLVATDGKVDAVIATVLDITERVRMQTALAESQRFTRATLDALPANLCVVDERGAILFVNATWNRFAQANGVVPQSVGVGCNYLEVCRHAAGPGSDEAAAFAVQFDALLHGKRNEFEMEYPCHSPDEKRWFIGRVTRFPGDGAVRAIILHTNITERKRVEEALRENVEKLRLFIHNAPSAIAIFNRDMRYLAYSRRWLTDYRLTDTDISDRTHYEVFPDLPERWKEVHRRCLAGATEKCEEDRFPRGDGTLDWIRWEIHPWYTSANLIGGIILFSEDITARKQLEQTLRENSVNLRDLSRRLMEVEEQGRRQLGRELHDRVGPNLSAMLLSLGMIRSKLPPAVEQELGTHFDDCGGLLNETVAHLRDVLANLRPPALEDLGLIAALGHLVRQTADRRWFEYEIEGREPSPRLPAATEIALFRILQEALTNVVKHAHATRVSLTLHTEGKQAVLTLADNGRGFDSAVPFHAGVGLGLTTMRERADALGGRLKVESAPGKGTRVTVAVPRGGGRNDGYSHAG